MKSAYKVLVFPGGTEIGLEIGRSLRQNKLVELFGAGMNVSSHAEFFFKNYFTVPPVSETGWVTRLNNVIQDHAIDFVYPADDDVLLALARNRTSLAARVVTSPLRTCEITRSKSATYRLLGGSLRVPAGFATPAEVPKYPVFVKPDAGQGSQRSCWVGLRGELEALLTRHSDLLVLEGLPGREFTVDCFSDRERGLQYVNGRERVRTRAGISMNCRQAQDPRFCQYAECISEALAFHGAWFFQIKETADGEMGLLEVAPRVAGTSAFARALGVNLPLLSIYEQERVPAEIALNQIDLEIDRALENRYRHSLDFRTLYLDLDDTLLLNGCVNADIVKLIYQVISRGVRVVLLTRHDGNLQETLGRYRLGGLFDEIIHLRLGEAKSDFIHDLQAILIDDSFSERAAVQARTGIPVFDPSMVEVLFDDRQ